MKKIYMLIVLVVAFCLFCLAPVARQMPTEEVLKEVPLSYSWEYERLVDKTDFCVIDLLK